MVLVDFHANLPALESILAQEQAYRYDAHIHLGELLSAYENRQVTERHFLYKSFLGGRFSTVDRSYKE